MGSLTKKDVGRRVCIPWGKEGGVGGGGEERINRKNTRRGVSGGWRGNLMLTPGVTSNNSNTFYQKGKVFQKRDRGDPKPLQRRVKK